MSADNWAICPRCRDIARSEHDARLATARDSYGKVPIAEYELLRDAADIPVDHESFRTFREDYEFSGASGGTIIASYCGHCEKCGLGIDFTCERVFYRVGAS